MRFLKHYGELSPLKLIMAGIVVGGLVMVTFISPRDAKYFEAVEKEIRIAKQICENSSEWAVENIERLKIDSNTLDRVPVNNTLPKLKYVDYPRAMYLHTGFVHSGAGNEFFCTFSDPRGAKKYYFDYNNRLWINKTRSRRSG